METGTKVAAGVVVVAGSFALWRLLQPKVVIKTLKKDAVNKSVSYYMKYYGYEMTDTFVLGDAPNIIPVGDGKHLFVASGIPLTGSIELDIGYNDVNGGFISEKGVQIFFDDAAVSGKGISRDQAKEIAADWHGGQNSPLYQFASSGIFLPELRWDYVKEIQDDLDTPNIKPAEQKRLLSLLRFFDKEAK